MRITEYRSADGKITKFSAPQRIALERAGVWRGYDLVTSYEGEPTHSDAEIADMCGAAPCLTRIGVKHKPYRDAQPYITYDPRPGYAPYACEDIGAAMDQAKKLGCDVVVIDAEDMQPDWYTLATDRRVTVLAV